MHKEGRKDGLAGKRKKEICIGVHKFVCLRRRKEGALYFFFSEKQIFSNLFYPLSILSRRQSILAADFFKGVAKDRGAFVLNYNMSSAEVQGKKGTKKIK